MNILCVVSCDCVIVDVKVFGLIFSVFITEMVGQQRFNMFFNMDYVLEKQSSQLFIEIVKGDDFLEGDTANEFCAAEALKGAL